MRGALIAFACAGLQLAVTVQSRGWLFTLPLVAIVAIVVMPDRLRVAAAAVLPVGGALVADPPAACRLPGLLGSRAQPRRLPEPGTLRS